MKRHHYSLSLHTASQLKSAYSVRSKDAADTKGSTDAGLFVLRR